MNIGALTATLGVDTSGLDKAVQRMQQTEASMNKSISKINSKLEDTGKKISQFGKVASTYVTLPLLAVAGVAFKMASDLEENINKTDVAFKENAENIKEWSKTTLTSFGIAQSSALEMASLFGDMGTSMGLSTARAADMSKSLVGLAGDLASFKNIQIETAQTALAGIFTGETESLKKLGIVLTEVNLQEYAFSQGIKQKVNDMSQSEKVMLRYNYILNVTKNSQGDFARTSDGAANQMRIFQESLKEVGATFGQILLPVLTPVLAKINEIMQAIGRMTERQRTWIVGIALVAAAIGPLAMAIGFLTSTVIPGIILAGGKLVAMFTALNAVIIANPMGVLAMALIAVGAAAYGVYNSMGKLTATQKLANDLSIKVSQSMVEEKRNIEKLIATVNDDTASKEKKKLAIEDLNRISPAYLGFIDEDAVRTGIAQKAIDLYIKSLEQKARAQAAEEMYVALEKDRIKLIMESANAQQSFGSVLWDTFTSGGNAILGATKQTREFAASMSEITKNQAFLKAAMEAPTPTAPDFAAQAETIGAAMKNVKTMNLAQVNAVKDRVNEQLSLEKQYTSNLLREQQELLNGKATLQAYQRQGEIDAELEKNQTNLKNYQTYLNQLNTMAKTMGGLDTGGGGGIPIMKEADQLSSKLSLIGESTRTAVQSANLLRGAFGNIAGDLDAENITSQLAWIAQQNSVLGDSFDSTSAQLSVWTAEWKRLFDEGLRPKDSAYDFVTNKIKELNGEIATSSEELKKLQEQQMVFNSLSNAATDMAFAIGGAMAGAGDAAQSFAEIILGTAQQVIGAMLKEAFTALFLHGATKGLLGLTAAAIGVGALMAMFQQSKKQADSAARLADGGIIPPGYPNDTFNAKLSSQEAVIPLDRLGEMMGKGEVKERKVVFQIKGRTLEAIMDEQDKYGNSY